MKINKFDDFDDYLLESETRNSVSELPFVLSDELINILKHINHPISKQLLEKNEEREESKVTFIDVDNDIYSKGVDSDVYFKRFTVVNSNKAYDNIIDFYLMNSSNKTDEEKKQKIVNYLRGSFAMQDPSKYDYTYMTKNRSVIKIGSFVKKIFGDEFKDGGDPGNDVESFVNSVIAYRKSNFDKVNKKEFKLVKGHDIVTYYNEDRYDGDKGPLHGSCMRYDECTEYIEFYAINPSSSLLILTSGENSDNIVGRAMVWDLSMPSGRTFMDRIYTVYDDDVELFKLHAIEQGWLYKKRQNMDVGEAIVDPITNITNNIILVTNKDIKTNEYYPYMDTLAIFNVEKHYLSNNSDFVERDTDEDYYTLKGTDGDDYEVNEGEERQFVDYYGRAIESSELTYCEYGNDYRLSDDYEELGSIYHYENATNTFIQNEMIWSHYHDQYIMTDNSVFSEYHDSEILDDESIDVITDAHFDTFQQSLDNSKSDYRHNDEIGESVIEYNPNNVSKNIYYYDMEYNEDVFVTCLVNNNSIESKHLIWDKNNLIRYHDNKYPHLIYKYIDNQKDKDDAIGQTRLFDNKQYINENSNSDDEKVINYLYEMMKDDKKEYIGDIKTKFNLGSKWNDDSWICTEILQFLSKSYSTSYTLREFGNVYDYEKLKNILKRKFKSQYEECEKDFLK